MRELREQGLTLQEIAKRTGFSPATVHLSVRNIPVPYVMHEKILRVGLDEGAILDIETSGLDPVRDDLIAFGFLGGNVIGVIQRGALSAEDFHQHVIRWLSCVSPPLYAYSAPFVCAFLKEKLGVSLEISDIMYPWFEEAERRQVKAPKLDELAPLPMQYFGYQSVTGPDIPRLWYAYQGRRDKRCLSLIAKHIMDDLRQALYVLSFMKEDLRWTKDEREESGSRSA